MGLLSQLRALNKKGTDARILVLGLDNAGKTTILKALSQEEITQIMPTQGFNIKSLQHENFKLTVWDIGGQRAIRAYWSNYFTNTDGLIYVVDSSDEERLAESKDELLQLLNHELLVNVPLLIYCNKQDIATALDADEIEENLDLTKIEDRIWTIASCSALTGEGLSEGVSWMIKQMDEKNKSKSAAGASAAAAAEK